MIKVENFNFKAEGNMQTLLLDFACTITSVRDILIRSYGLSRKEAEKLLNYSFKTHMKIKTKEFEERLADE